MAQPLETRTNPVPESTFDLWQRMARFPASESDAALKFLQEWIAEQTGADNVIWIGGVRVQRGAEARADAFLGWRLRARVALHPDPTPYREQLAQYYDSEHYGKITPTYYQRSHEAKKEDHVGMDSRASMSGCGHFRVGHIRDPKFLDFAAFQQTAHYQRYYRNGGVADRFLVGCPVTKDHESLWMVDRWKSRRPFTTRQTLLVGDALRGLPGFHRHLVLGSGLLFSDKPLSPMEHEILKGLLTTQSEKEIAAALDRIPSTMHKHVLGLYERFGVKSRQALMALWLGGD